MDSQQVSTQFLPERLLHSPSELVLVFSEYQLQLLVTLMAHHLVDEAFLCATSAFT